MTKVARQKLSPLSKHLRQRGVSSYDPDHVGCYMKQELAKANTPPPAPKFTWISIPAMVIGVCLIAYVLMSPLIILIPLAMGRDVSPLGRNDIIYLETIFCLGTFSMGFGLWAHYAFCRHQGRRVIMEWKESSFDDYCKLVGNRAIPPKVLSIAEKIKTIPRSRIIVHHLGADPVMEIQHFPEHGSSERKFVAVWNGNSVF